MGAHNDAQTDGHAHDVAQRERDGVFYSIYQVNKCIKRYALVHEQPETSRRADQSSSFTDVSGWHSN